MIREYLRSILCDESYDFYLESQIYEKEDNLKKRRKLAAKILESFIADDSTNQVNLPSEVKDRVLVEYENGDFGSDLFFDCKMAICKLLVLDSLPRYLSLVKSSGFTNKCPPVSFVKEKFGGLSPHVSEGSMAFSSEGGKGKRKGNKNKSSRSVDRANFDAVPPPATFEEAMKLKNVFESFHDFLEQSYSNEYLDFFVEATQISDVPYEDESDKKEAFDELCKKYFGLGLEDPTPVVSFNFDVMDDFQDKLKKGNYNNLFSNMIAESKDIIKSQYHNYVWSKK